MVGCIKLIEVIRKGEQLLLNKEQKKMLLFGVILLFALKITELPYQNIPTYESIIAVILIGIFIYYYILIKPQKSI